jgi:spermidine/putrescine transport system permease protein
VILLFAATGPLLIVLVYSFLTPGDYGGVVWTFSTDAWFNVVVERDFFDDTLSFADAHLSIFWRSVKLSLVTTLVAFIVGFPTAYFIATRPRETRDMWMLLIMVPFWTNLLIRTFAVMEIIRNEGVINTGLIQLGIIDAPIQMLFTEFAVTLGMVYVYLPLMVLPIYASMERMDFSLIEAGYDLYASRWRILRKVIFPLVKPGVVAGSILVFVPALGAYVTPRVLGGGKQLMLGNLIELQFGQGRNWPLGAALSISLLAIVMVALFVYVRSAGTQEGRHD